MATTLEPTPATDVTFGPDICGRMALNAAYFLGMSGIGFALPYLPLYLKEEKGFTDRGIAAVWVVAALAGLVQFPLGLWSDKLGSRKPFLIGALGLLALATWLLPGASPEVTVLVGLLVVLFAENGPCRATVESLAGAEAARLAPPGGVGAALGALRFWRPVSIVAVALVGGWLAESRGVAFLLWPVAALQTLAVLAAVLIREPKGAAPKPEEVGAPPDAGAAASGGGRGLRDPGLWVFVGAMVLFHVANAPGGAYLGLYLKQDLGAPQSYLSYAFVVSMVAWMLAVRPAGTLADRLGRKPLLVAGWAIMTLRLVLIALAHAGWQVFAVQPLDGLGQGLFAVAAAAWVSDRLADPKRVGEAQVVVGCALVGGSALGPALAGLVVDSLGYRGTFWVLAGVGALATAVVVFLVPETKAKAPKAGASHERRA